MRDTSGPQMVPVLKQPPKWESRLILPTSPFPNRGKEYTVSGVVLYASNCIVACVAVQPLRKQGCYTNVEIKCVLYQIKPLVPVTSEICYCQTTKRCFGLESP